MLAVGTPIYVQNLKFKYVYLWLYKKDKKYVMCESKFQSL
jgi:hypothetical protein